MRPAPNRVNRSAGARAARGSRVGAFARGIPCDHPLASRPESEMRRHSAGWGGGPPRETRCVAGATPALGCEMVVGLGIRRRHGPAGRPHPTPRESTNGSTQDPGADEVHGAAIAVGAGQGRAVATDPGREAPRRVLISGARSLRTETGNALVN